jgi:hypothetical protein
MRALITAVVGFVVLLAAPLGALAGEPSPVWKDGWTINIPGQSNWVSDATPSPFNLQSAPSTPYVPGSVKNPYGFADYSIGRTLGVGQELGLGNMQATLGVRMAAFDTSGATINSALPNFASSGTIVNVDGKLGLSYWFDSASKLTLGYHADYFKGSSAFNIGTAADNANRVDHGPMVRFSIQK